jgi:hypothetical protein
VLKLCYARTPLLGLMGPCCWREESRLAGDLDLKMPAICSLAQGCVVWCGAGRGRSRDWPLGCGAGRQLHPGPPRSADAVVCRQARTPGRPHPYQEPSPDPPSVRSAGLPNILPLLSQQMLSPPPSVLRRCRLFSDVNRGIGRQSDGSSDSRAICLLAGEIIW